MPFEQRLGQEQRQIQKLVLTQQMQQSIRILRYNIEDLHDFMQQKQLDNPFVKIKTSSIKRTVDSGKSFSLEDELVSRQTQSLPEYLLSQVHLTMRKTILRGWVVFLIDHLDQNGYLTLDIDTICQQTQVDQTTLIDALTLLQQLDPPGVGARNLQECLLLQIENDDRSPLLALEIVQDHFEEFADHRWKEIAMAIGTSTSEVQQSFEYIKTLSPAPGAAFQTDSLSYIYPDLLVDVSTDHRKIEVKLSSENQPQIIFNQKYYEKFSKSADVDVKAYLNEKRAEYISLENNLAQRGQTILRVGKVIVDHQQDFFLDKTHPLKPLLLRDVAQKLGLHESTISRAVHGKYLKCNFGVFELKTFFKRAVTTSQHDDLSVDEAQSQIKALIDAEKLDKPLSDSQLANLLKQNGILLSRRTVAKYREELGIKSSIKRKKI
ncbi:MAG: RNA polymerase factor sigma-54 [Liquorilactobacillus nagelii]|jgi:RNA polymerase sigma-54 factor|uniref:RNA polymerase sigma-54 factor n=1 Tax=Liquorilactobacillus nagelii TaxID=82688 RepID=A0A3Q8CB97_9LACO|nr:RNA polymerase factor sigma-54 [Liquorilactobacillus nagelii]AUJ31546.1 RNA polymerase sigma-54 factor [Liquorilactobacillus nagelii]KRL40593.1 RNA polymerase factor sigma-54 [Liquorilactobacillus nagelii DSM 13675]MCC7616094.1 RNA polymerase sigma-54 factor [Liquorilactobacillus nagelii]MCI1699661.1 RNA polymerase factor sigma-54 [Liquorilactobacillus nagelii]MCP9314401.1 RNA polymerase factor sigma-54 [Liquorilactobacillus nagelii]